MTRVYTAIGPLEVWLNECTYNPSHDSLLAIEALKILRDRGASYDSVLDLGTGSGVLALASYILFKPRRLGAIDLSWCSLEAARMTLPSGALLALCDKGRCLRGGWDLVVVNPPYLPEEPPEPPWGCGEMLEAAWSGLGVVEGMVKAAAGLGREVLVVYSSLTRPRPPELLKRLGFHLEILVKQGFFMEELSVVYGVRSGEA